MNEHTTGHAQTDKAVPLSGGRLWLIRLIAFVAAPALFFILLELSLRIAGVGYSTSYFVPSTIEGKDYLVPNSYFSYRFFPPELARRPMELRITVDKPVDTYRIFLFGESAAYGDPDPAYGVGRYLEILLQDRYPGTNFEIVSTAMTAINSHAILPIAQEMAELDGDLWIIYMGNNEMIGAFGPGTVFSSKAPSLGVIRTILAAKSTRTGQLMDMFIRQLQAKENKTPKEWGGINMFSKNLAYNDPGRLVAYNNFQGNLQDILDAAINSDTPVLLSTVGSNLRHTAPFNSMNTESLSGEQLEQWESNFNQGKDLERDGSCTEALEHYLLAETIDPTHAELQYRIGRCHLLKGNPLPAQVAFTKARDFDGLAVRADTRINNIIRNTTNQYSDDQVRLIDTVKLLAAESPDGITGHELFYEHVHFTLNGNYQLARILAEEVVMKLPQYVLAKDTGKWADAGVCDKELAVTVWDQHQLWKNMTPRLSAPPHKGTLNYSANIDYSKAQTKAVISRIDLNKTPEEDNNLYLRAIEKRPDDTWLRTHYAQYLANNGELSAAIKQLETVCKLLPDLEWPHLFLGEYQGRARRYKDAAKSFQRALEIRSDFMLAQKGLEKIKKLNDGYK